MCVFTDGLVRAIALFTLLLSNQSVLRACYVKVTNVIYIWKCIQIIWKIVSTVARNATVTACTRISFLRYSQYGKLQISDVMSPNCCHVLVNVWLCSKEIHLKLVQNYFSRSNACLEIQPQHSECFWRPGSNYSTRLSKNNETRWPQSSLGYYLVCTLTIILPIC